MQFELPYAVTCFSYSPVCRTGVVTSSKKKACPRATAVLLPGAGASHWDPLLWRHGQVTAPATVC